MGDLLPQVEVLTATGSVEKYHVVGGGKMFQREEKGRDAAPAGDGKNPAVGDFREGVAQGAKGLNRIAGMDHGQNPGSGTHDFKEDPEHRCRGIHNSKRSTQQRFRSLPGGEHDKLTRSRD